MFDALPSGMRIRSKLLAALLLVSLIAIFAVAEAGLAPDRSHDTPPPVRVNPLELVAREAALKLFSMGCLEVTVMILPDPYGQIRVVASCLEWQGVLPASQ